MIYLFTGAKSFLWIGSIFYCLAFLFALGSIVRGKRYPRWILLMMIGGGFTFQTLGLYLRGLETRSCPLGNPFELIQFITWSVILLYMLVGPAFHISLLGFFSAGMAALLSVISLLVTPWDQVQGTRIFGDDPWVETHAATAIFSYGVFGILALTSVMYLIQNYGLKQKHYKGLFPILPSLVQLDQINRRLLITGVTVLSFSLAIGVFYWIKNIEEVQGLKLIFTLALWTAYCTVLVLHKINRLITRRFAWSCVVLFGFALISLGPVDASRRSQIDNTRQQP